jgi:hypothetical protein
MTRVLFTLFSFFIFSVSSFAETDSDCYKFVGCLGGSGGRGGQASTNPSYGNQIRINPSAVPTEKGVGLEGIFYNSETDFSIVQGLGRVGAAISPSNSEETFFGPPGFEQQSDLLERKTQGLKFPTQKYTLATAVNIVKKSGSGLKAKSLQLGVMGRYNKLTKTISPGAGLNGILGPLTFGASQYADETRIEDDSIPEDVRYVFKYQVKTYQGGISLGSLLLDYSVLRVEVPEIDNVYTVKLMTASLLVKRMILTYSKRTEDSLISYYNYSTKQLETQQIKEDFFAGIQLNATHNLMLGLLYNYYQLHEYSLTATYFF